MNIQGHQRELSSTHFLDLLFFGAHNAEGFSGIQPCPLTVTETHPAISSAAGPRREVLVDLERSPYRYY